MENKQHTPQEIIKMEKNHWGIRIFIIQFVLFLILVTSFAFSTASFSGPPTGVMRIIFFFSDNLFIPSFLILLTFIFSINLFIKFKKGGKVYTMVDVIVTSIIPAIVFVILMNSVL